MITNVSSSGICNLAGVCRVNVHAEGDGAVAAVVDAFACALIQIEIAERPGNKRRIDVPVCPVQFNPALDAGRARKIIEQTVVTVGVIVEYAVFHRGAGRIAYGLNNGVPAAVRKDAVADNRLTAPVAEYRAAQRARIVSAERTVQDLRSGGEVRGNRPSTHGRRVTG